MLAVKQSRIFIFAMAACIGLILASCGGSEGGEETVYLYITNGYPGASAMTVYGPTGTLVSGLKFSESTTEPIEVDRNVNSTDFTLVIDGAPTAIGFTKPLFAMYPQETGTLVISRRSDEGAAEATLYRHIRTPDPDCVMIFGNSLSLNNSLLAEELNSYSYQTEWQRPAEPMYDRTRERYATTRCGYTPVLENYKRLDLHDKIANDLWFYPVSASDGGYTLVWAVRLPDPSNENQPRSEGLLANGQIKAHPTTKDFMKCLSSAVSVEQEQSAPGGGSDAQECPDANGGDSGSETGPDGALVLGKDQVVWNSEAVLTCFELFSYSGFPVDPGQTDTFQAFSMGPRQNVDPDNSDEYMCGSRVRIRTPVQDLIFQNIDDSVHGWSNDEGLIEVDATFPMSEQHFFVVYGRPVNAFVNQWNGEATSKSLEEFPYPGSVLPDYGNSSSN
jgi:hypothetical protein